MATISAGALSLLVAPLSATAQVVISEIMYNPDGSDSGREWVELYNAGASDVPIVGGTVKDSWRISDGSNHTFTDPSGGIGRGSLTIPAGGYLVVSSDPSAFLADYPSGSYSVVKSSISLNNTGSTIAVVDGTGATLDSVSYTKDEGAYDDGTSLQKTASGTWIAAMPTPGSANATAAYTPPPTDAGSEPTNTSSTSDTGPTHTSSSGSGSSLPPPPPVSVYVDAGADRAVVTGADVEFEALVYDSSRKAIPLSDPQFSWNFGDGTTGGGSKVTHHWDAAGSYAVVLSVRKDGHIISDTLKVSVDPVAITLDPQPDGSISLTNGGKHDADLSGWFVAEPGARSFALPPHTILLAGGTTRISPSVLGFEADSKVKLQFPAGGIAVAVASVVSNAMPATTASFAPPLASIGAPLPVAPSSTPATSTKKEVKADDEAAAPLTQQDPPDPATPSSSTILLSQTASAASFASGSWWWLSALALAGLGAVALMLSRKRAQSEWDIIEDIAE